MSLTNDDKNWIIDQIIQNNKHLFTGMKEIFATKPEFKKIEDKIVHLPTIDQFNDFKDSVLGSINKHESELLIVSARLARLEERVEVLYPPHLGMLRVYTPLSCCSNS